MKYLIELGANVKTCENYALIHCAKLGMDAKVKILIENGADVCDLDNWALRETVAEFIYEELKWRLYRVNGRSLLYYSSKHLDYRLITCQSTTFILN